METGGQTEQKKTGARRAEDLTGRQFGELTVLWRTENRNGRTCWVCRCSCGRLHTATAHNLKNNHIRSCGASSHRSERGMADISGRRFGRLTALYATSERDKKGSIVWHCRCDCGNETEVTEDGLVHGTYRSCGCLREEIRKNIPNQLHRVDGTCVEWLEKRKYRRDNTSGFRGVNRLKSGVFQVTIGFKGRKYYVGRYRSYEQAVQARLETEELIHEGFVRAYRLWQQRSAADPEWAQENPLVFEVEKGDGGFRIITNMAE